MLLVQSKLNCKVQKNLQIPHSRPETSSTELLLQKKNAVERLVVVGFEKCFDEWISQSNFHRCMLFFLEEDIVQGEGSPLFRDAKMSKGNKVVLKSLVDYTDLDSEEAEE